MATPASIVQTPDLKGDGNYPFTDRSSMTSREGVIVPKEVFLDARLYAPGAGETQYISSIQIDGEDLVITVEDQQQVIATGTYDGTDGSIIRLLDAYDREVGVLYGNPTVLQGLAPAQGTLTFSPSGMRFLPSVATSSPSSGVDTIADSEGKALFGDVWLIGEKGVVLTRDNNTITVNIVGDPYFIRRLCLAESGAIGNPVPDYPRPLRKVTFKQAGRDDVPVTGNAYGNIQVEPGRGDNADGGTVPDNPIRVRYDEDNRGFTVDVIGNFA